MDNIALELKKAAQIIQDNFLSNTGANRYKGWSGDFGVDVLYGNDSLESLCDKAKRVNLKPAHESGQQELFVLKIKRVIYG